MMDIKKPESFKDTKPILNGNYFIYILFLAVLFVAASIIQSAIITGVMCFDYGASGKEFDELTKVLSSNDAIMEYVCSNAFTLGIFLLATIGGVIATFIFMKFIEKRTLKGMGFRKPFFKNYLGGILIGTALLLVCITIELLTGSISFKTATSFSIIGFLFVMIGFMIQSFEEEFICRSMYIGGVGSKRSILLAITISSILFGLTHLFNASFSVLACLNIIIIGFCFGFLYILTDNIWLVSGIHFIWNFAQGAIFGIEVSGIKVVNSILKATPNNNSLINGGVFGIEGGITATIAYSVLLIILLVIIKKKGLFIKKNNNNSN